MLKYLFHKIYILSKLVKIKKKVVFLCV